MPMSGTLLLFHARRLTPLGKNVKVHPFVHAMADLSAQICIHAVCMNSSIATCRLNKIIKSGDAIYHEQAFLFIPKT